MITLVPELGCAPINTWAFLLDGSDCFLKYYAGAPRFLYPNNLPYWIPIKQIGSSGNDFASLNSD